MSESEFVSVFFEKNFFGDIIALYNINGVLIGTYTYDAWGNHTYTESGNSSLTSAEVRVGRYYNPFRYRGYYYDSETGLYYLQSRYYDPATGRFLNADGQLNATLLGYNMYVYCYNNPILYVDYYGTDATALIPLVSLLPIIDGPLPFGEIAAIVTIAIIGTQIPAWVDDAYDGRIIDDSEVIDYQYERVEISPSEDPYILDTPILEPDPAPISPFPVEVPDDVSSVIVNSKQEIKQQGLPTKGKIRYVPIDGKVVGNSKNGFIDRFGNVWKKGASRTFGERFEWDVQLSRRGRGQLGWASRDGYHINVSLGGKLTHK